uniref:Uncharacterized protein n=2 Tax=Oryza sativa subsp. japonica TaxID=39947 RepID=Q5VM74_ORYSJ|nr:hypothetical protein [Oryza sativa Japonica Group]BAD69451.1 hypothetical protein [Oryza sativa Japonica Group]
MMRLFTTAPSARVAVLRAAVAVVPMYGGSRAADPEKVAHLDSTVHVVNNPTPRHGHKTGADKAAEAADPKSESKPPLGSSGTKCKTSVHYKVVWTGAYMFSASPMVSTVLRFARKII